MSAKQARIRRPLLSTPFQGWLPHKHIFFHFPGNAFSLTNFKMPPSEIPTETLALSILLGLSAIGTSIVNDFKSVEGDKQMGLSSIPVLYGEQGAKWATVWMTNVPQILAATYLAFGRDQPVRFLVGFSLICCHFLPLQTVIPCGSRGGVLQC